MPSEPAAFRCEVHMTTLHPSAQPPSDPWLRRVQALLAKAESTEFPAEAETLLAKARSS